MDRLDIKMYSSKELRNIRQMIREELDFRADVGREIESSAAQSDMEDKFPHIRERMESMRDWDRKKQLWPLENHGPGPDEER